VTAERRAIGTGARATTVPAGLINAMIEPGGIEARLVSIS